MEKLAVGASPDLVDHRGLKINEDGPEIAIDARQCSTYKIPHYLGTCLPEPVSEKKVEKESSCGLEASIAGRVPSGCKGDSLILILYQEIFT